MDATLPLLDARGLRCPEPVMLLHNRMNQLKAGERIRLLVNDPASKRDVIRFCNFLGHQLLQQEHSEDEFEFVIEKGLRQP